MSSEGLNTSDEEAPAPTAEKSPSQISAPPKSPSQTIPAQKSGSIINPPKSGSLISAPKSGSKILEESSAPREGSKLLNEAMDKVESNPVISPPKSGSQLIGARKSGSQIMPPKSGSKLFGESPPSMGGSQSKMRGSAGSAIMSSMKSGGLSPDANQIVRPPSSGDSSMLGMLYRMREPLAEYQVSKGLPRTE